MAASGRLALVTGGAGFIGGHLCEGLLDAGWQVRVLDDLSSGHEQNLAAVADQVEFIEADVCDAARLAGVRRLIYAASAYGAAPRLPTSESAPANPASPYALQKYAGELYCRLYHSLYAFETVALRYFNVYGPRQAPASDYAVVIPSFARACLAGDQPLVWGDGEQTRDFVTVEDVVEANLLAADSPGAAGAVCNVAAGRRIRLNELLGHFRALLGRPVDARYGAPRAGDVRDSQACLQRARELLDYEPRVELREGLRPTLEDMRARGPESARMGH